MKKFALLFLLTCSPSAALAQGTMQADKAMIATSTVKELPPGYEHIPTQPAEYRVESSAGKVLCKTEANAISYGKKLAHGKTRKVAIQEMTLAWGKEKVCGPRPNLKLIFGGQGIRGDDAGRPI